MVNLTHINDKGDATMVDVTAKDITRRQARAAGSIFMEPETLALIESGGVKKGDVLSVARIAGIMAAKKTYELVPLCHPLALTGIDVEFEFDQEGLIENLIAFNLGVELGQFFALTFVLILLSVWRRYNSYLKFSVASNALLMSGGIMLTLFQLTGYITQ